MAKPEPQQLEFPRPKTLGKIGMAPVSTLKSELARTYRVAREAAGLTQRELAERLGVQQKFVAWCELEGERETFTSAHLTMGPPEWSFPIVSAMVVHLGAQVTKAVEIRHKLHVVRLADIVQTSSGATVGYSTAVASEREDWSIATLENQLRANRALLDTAMETDRALSVELRKRRGGR